MTSPDRWRCDAAGSDTVGCISNDGVLVKFRIEEKQAVASSACSMRDQASFNRAFLEKKSEWVTPRRPLSHLFFPGVRRFTSASF
jgi:hypothetical protein